MQKRVKINYNQYKHLIDVCNTGDFLIESLEDQKELTLCDKKINCKVKDLLTKDNVLYWTQNTKRTFKVPVGLNVKEKRLIELDLMGDSWNIKSCFLDDLENFNKLFLLNLLQSYAPSEYIVYSDCLPKEFEDLENFNRISDCDELDNLYSNIAYTRHKKYIDSGVYTYRDYRKFRHGFYCIFLLSDIKNIKRINSISGGSIRYGISVFSLLQTDKSLCNSINLDDTIRPEVSKYVIEEELKEYNKLIGDVKNMKKNLIIGFEEDNDGDLHEELLFSEDINKCPSALYNMREYGYQFGGIRERGDSGSNYHHLLQDCCELEKDAVEYIVNASVCDVLYLKATSLRSAIASNGGLSESDKALLGEFVSKQVGHYYEERNYFDIVDYEGAAGNKSIYTGRFCRIEREDLSLYFIMGNNKILLPRSFLYFLKTNRANSRQELNENLINLIIAYELVKQFDYKIPEDYVDGYWAGHSTIKSFEEVLSIGNLPKKFPISNKDTYLYVCRGAILKILENNGRLMYAELSTEQEEMLEQFLEDNCTIPESFGCESEIESENRIVYISYTFEILIKEKYLYYKSLNNTLTKIPSNLISFIGSSAIIELIDCSERYKLNINKSELNKAIGLEYLQKSKSFS